jgi:hypothetical protein
MSQAAGSKPGSVPPISVRYRRRNDAVEEVAGGTTLLICASMRAICSINAVEQKIINARLEGKSKAELYSISYADIKRPEQALKHCIVLHAKATAIVS